MVQSDNIDMKIQKTNFVIAALFPTDILQKYDDFKNIYQSQ